MKRLLKDAQKLTGIKYDINNLSDVYEAIHVIQEELDITGTTAKEASTTFSGSFASMKASLQNLLGSMALGEDIKPKLQELAGTVYTFFVGNFIPMVGNVLSSIPDLVGGTILIGVGAIFGEDMAQTVGKQLEKVSGIVTTFWDMLFGSLSEKDNIDFLANLGIDEKTASAIVSIAENVRVTFEDIWTAVNNVVGILGEFVGEILGVAESSESVNGVAEAFEFLSGVVRTVADAIKNFTAFLRENEIALAVTKTLLVGLLTGFLALKVVAGVAAIIKGLSTALVFLKGVIGAVKLGWLALQIAFISNPIGVIVTAIAAVVGALTWFFTQTDIGKQIWSDFVEWIKGVFDGFVNFFTELWQGISNFLVETWNAISSTVMAIVQPFVDWLVMIWSPVIENLSGIFEGLKMIFVGAWEFIKSIVMGAVIIILDIISGNFEKLGEHLDIIWNSIKNAVSMVWDGIKMYFEGVINAIVGTVSNVLQAFSDFLTGLWDGIKSTAINLWDGLKNGVIGIVDGIVSGAQRAWDNLTGGVKNAVDEVGKFFDRLWNIDLFGAGKAIIDGFLGGLKAAWDGVTGFISGIANWIAEHKGPIEYDRKLLIPAGNAIMYGLNEGLKDNFETVKGTVSGMAREISNQFSTDALNVGVADVAAELSVNTQTYADLASTNNSESVVAQLTVVENVLQQILDKDVNTYLDGEVLAKNSYDRQYSFMQREGI